MKRFYNLNISTKLISGFVLVAMIAVVVGIVGIRGARDINDSDTELYEHGTVPLSALGDLAEAFQKVRLTVAEIILTESREDAQKGADKIKALTAEITKLSDEYEKGIASEELKNEVQKFRAVRKEFLPLRDRCITLALEGKKAEAVQLLRGDFDQAGAAVSAEIDRLQEIGVKTAKAISNHIDAVTDRTTWTIVATMSIGALLALGLGLWLAQLISKPVRQVAEHAEKLRGLCIASLGKASEEMARGNLNVKIETGIALLEIDSQDEIGALAGSVNGIIRQTQSTVAAFEQALAVL